MFSEGEVEEVQSKLEQIMQELAKVAFFPDKNSITQRQAALIQTDLNT